MTISFSKYSKAEKLAAIAEKTGFDPSVASIFSIADPKRQSLIDGISENTVANYVLPYSVVPNMLVNNREYFVPMVTEESSVVAAASSAAKFWKSNGGFTSTVISVVKPGQIHFLWKGHFEELQRHFPAIKITLEKAAEHLLEPMKRRGGGLVNIELLDFSNELPNYFQIRAGFVTADAMGANLINSCLESMAKALTEFFKQAFTGEQADCEIIMAILSNHTPHCLVECYAECPIAQLATVSGDLSAADFARKFKTAVDISHIDIYRAATHNKGIYNGIDAVVVATGNDFRAVEADGHSYAARSGKYQGLSVVTLTEGRFRLSVKLPLALGTVGGLTTVHPLAAESLKMLGNPSAQDLMQITAAVGLASHFSAIKALISTGIQHGHMKFHLNNILQLLGATPEQQVSAQHYFAGKTITYRAVMEFLE